VNTSTSKSSKPKANTGSITRLSSKRKRSASPAERLATEGVDMPHLLTELEQLSEVNASRVVKLHDRIAAGEYIIDSRRVAQKMIDFEASLDD